METIDDSSAIEIRIDGQTGYACLNGEVTIATVDELKDPLFGLLNSATIRVDLSKVSELDSCGLQLLLILHQQAVLRERDFGLIARQPQLDDLLALYGLSLPDASDATEVTS